MYSSYYPTNITFQTASAGYTFEPAGGSENDVYNLQVLFDRLRPGALFRVNDEGRLQVVEGILGHISYYWNRKAEQAAVKEVVTSALNHYNHFLSAKEETEVDRIAVQTLFGRINTLSPQVLDHSHFGSHNKLSELSLPELTVRLKVGDKYIDYHNANVDGGCGKFLDFDLGNEDDNANLAMLLRRKKGERLRVGVWGRLEKVTDKRMYRFERADQEQRVQEVVTRVLGQLNVHLQELEVTRTHKVVLKQMFTQGPLMRMKREVYNRGAIAEDSHLEHVLSETLGSQLSQKREALKTALKIYSATRNKVEAKAVIEAKFMDLVLAEYYFAYQLGFDLERVGDGGSGGARYARDHFGQKILVVKPGDEGPHGANNPRLFAKVKRWFISPKSCLKGNSEPLAEVDSYLLDRRLGIYQVPPTEWRYIASRQFNGDQYKECSVQMFVNGCSTMGEYVSVSPNMHALPRPFLRWYCGEEVGEGCLGRLGTRQEKREELLEKIPQESVERIAAHNIGIEDVDCHFENILVMLRDAGGEASVIERIYNEEIVIDEEIDAFVDTFFSQGHNQEMLQAILFSEEVTINGEEKRVTFVKHDGGSSNPHKHPSGYLSTRFKYLFEVLPNFEQSFSEEMRELLANKERAFIEFLLEKGARALRNTHDPEVFKRYWDVADNRIRFKQWILETDPTAVQEARQAVIEDLLGANEITSDSPRYEAYRIYLHSHLERIHGNVETRIESWRLLQKHLNSDVPMRQVLQTRCQEDFDRELARRGEEEIDRQLTAAKARGVKIGNSHLVGRYFVGNHVLADLGERAYVAG